MFFKVAYNLRLMSCSLIKGILIKGTTELNAASCNFQWCLIMTNFCRIQFNPIKNSPWYRSQNTACHSCLPAAKIKIHMKLKQCI